MGYFDIVHKTPFTALDYADHCEKLRVSFTTAELSAMLRIIPQTEVFMDVMLARFVRTFEDKPSNLLDKSKNITDNKR